jgi:CRISPR-associated endonuclease/helicase Cas3
MSDEFSAHTPSDHDPNTWHELDKHLSKVADRAEGFAEKIGAGKIAHYVGLLHDIGKYNPEFQAFLRQCDRAKKTNQNHQRPKFLMQFMVQS